CSGAAVDPTPVRSARAPASSHTEPADARPALVAVLESRATTPVELQLVHVLRSNEEPRIRISEIARELRRQALITKHVDRVLVGQRLEFAAEQLTSQPPALNACEQNPRRH